MRRNQTRILFQCTRVYQNAQAREERVRELYGEGSNGSQGGNELTINPFYPEEELDAIHRERRSTGEMKEVKEEEGVAIKEELVDDEQVPVRSFSPQ